MLAHLACHLIARRCMAWHLPQSLTQKQALAAYCSKHQYLEHPYTAHFAHSVYAKCNVNPAYSLTTPYPAAVVYAAFTQLTQHAAGAEVSVSPVMGKGFRMERAPAAEHPTCLLFATGSGISPIKALIESDELQVRDLHCNCSNFSSCSKS